VTSRVAVVRTVGEIVLESHATPDPGEGEALVRVAECGLCGSDTKLYSGRHPTLQPPLRLGHEFHGVVEAHGPGGGGVEPGTRVAVFPPVGCGRCHNCRRGEPHVCVSMAFVGGELAGGLADLVAVPAANLVPMDPAVPTGLRVLVEPLAVGVHAADRAAVHADEEVLIVGAGPIGLFTALALRHAGVERILLADVADERLALARGIGAGATVNTRDTPLADHVHEAVRPEGVDVAFDCVGGQATAEQALGVTRKGGRAVLVGIMPPELRFDGVVLQRGERALIGVQMYTREDFKTAMDILAAGALADAGDLVRRYPLEDVATAFRDLEAGRRDVLKLVVAP